MISYILGSSLISIVVSLPHKGHFKSSEAKSFLIHPLQVESLQLYTSVSITSFSTLSS